MKRIIEIILFVVIVALMVFGTYKAAGAAPACQSGGTSTPTPGTECVGVPVGYGTVTPGPLWMNDCGVCLPGNEFMGTPTPAGTLPACWMGPSATGTPQPQPGVNCAGPTPSPTVILTSGPTVAPSATPNNLIGGLPTISIQNYATWGVIDSSSASCVELIASHQYKCTGSIDTHGISNAASLRPAINIVVSGTAGKSYYFQEYFTSSASPYFYTGPTAGNYNPSAWYSRVVTWTLSGNKNITYTVYGSSAGVGYRVTLTFEVLISTVSGASTPTPVPSVTPTMAPTPTGTPVNSMCYAIPDAYSDFSFEVFPPVGEPQCTGWDAFTLGETTVPAAQICYQPSGLGLVKLFGSEVPEVGTVLLAAAAAFLWRKFSVM